MKQKKIFFRLLLICLILLLSSAALSTSKQLDAKLAKLRAHKGAYTFIVIGDSRGGDKIYQNLIARALKRNPDFFVHMGDNIIEQGNRNDWAHFWKLSEAIDVPFFLTIGNHAVDDKESETVWKEEVDLPGNELYYSWVVGKSLFVVLDTFEMDREYKIEGAQLAWLKRTLDPEKYDHQFVFLHAPLYLNKDAFHYGDSLDKYPKLRDDLAKFFEEKKVNAVFTGHEHKYEKRKMGGVWQIITGGGGQRLYGKTFCHFVAVTVDEDRVNVKAIDKEGVMRDEFIMH